eukprot:7013148-Prymnesium_polylepis.1
MGWLWAHLVPTHIGSGPCPIERDRAERGARGTGGCALSLVCRAREPHSEAPLRTCAGEHVRSPGAATQVTASACACFRLLARPARTSTPGSVPSPRWRRLCQFGVFDHMRTQPPIRS